MKNFHSESIEEIFKYFNTSKKGLSDEKASKKLKEEGPNEIQTKSSINPFLLFLGQFKSFIIYILLFAVVLSFLLNHLIDAILILIILLANAFIGFFQELSAQKSLEALKNLNTTQARVFRSGHIISTNAKNLVRGDIIKLEVGDKVPADCRIIESDNLKIDESALTGESIPAQKREGTIEKEKQISEQRNMAFSSTIIVEGSCKAIVVKTAMATEIGKITTLIKDTKEELTPLQVRLNRFGKKLGLGIIAICIVIFLILLLTRGHSLSNITIFGLIAVSLAVAAVPTALPAVVTIALSIGVKKLLKKKSLVRKLSSVETLGSCNVICTDKTGTLTKNEMTVQYAWDIQGNEAKIGGIGYTPKGHISQKVNDILYFTGAVCNNASLYKKENTWKISGNPTEAALLVSSKKAGIEIKGKRIKEFPFTSERKMMSVIIEQQGKRKMYSKGAPNILLEKCSQVLINGKKEKINKEHKKTITQQVDTYSSKSLRVLGFAYKELSKNQKEESLIFIGLQAMLDPPREDVIEAIKKTKKAHIRTIMMTGDYKETAKAIAQKIGIKGKCITGEELEKLTDKQLEEELSNSTNIFARVIPQDKQRVVKVLQKLGHVVAMTGDGVNDAPALKKANIGVAVGSGTDVAKEASDLVLLDDSFSHIVNAIEEGRGIYDNIQKSIVLLLSGNFGEVLIIFLAVILGLNLPLTAVLLLWINLITDGAPALAFSVDPYDRHIMKRKPNTLKQGILPPSKLHLIGYRGVIGAVIGLIMFSFLSSKLLLAQSWVFTFIVLSELMLVLIIRKEYGVPFLTNKWLWNSLLLSIILQVIVLYSPLNSIFKVVPLGIFELLLLFAASFVFYLSYILYNFVVKIFRNRHLQQHL